MESPADSAAEALQRMNEAQALITAALRKLDAIPHSADLSYGWRAAVVLELVLEEIHYEALQLAEATGVGPRRSGEDRAEDLRRLQSASSLMRAWAPLFFPDANLP